MYKRVLIPLDGSELAETILPFAEKIAGPVDAEVVLLRAVEPMSPVEAIAAPTVMASDTLLTREMAAQEYLTALAERLSRKGLRVRTGIRLGLPAVAIVAEAATQGVDLIAMSTHGRSGLGRVVFGSVAETVLRTAPIPVLMIRMAAKAETPAGEAQAR